MPQCLYYSFFVGVVISPLTLPCPQVRPRGALFLDVFDKTESSLLVNYTLVANDLSLQYPYVAGGNQSQYIEALDTHQR